MAKLRKYDFVVGAETATPPAASTPTDSSDVVTLGYLQTQNEANVSSISNGASTKSVTYATAFADTNYALCVSIKNTVDSSPIFLMPIITAKSTTGFTVTLNAATDSANYVVEYIAVRFM